MKNMPTLADAVYRETFRDKEISSFRPLIQQANKFVLDDKMSDFLWDLMNSSQQDIGEVFEGLKDDIENEEISEDEFEKKLIYKAAKVNEHNINAINKTRTLSKAPFKTTWIEFNYSAWFNRAHKETKELKIKSGEKWEENKNDIQKAGWLIEQHPTNENAIKATYVILLPPNVKFKVFNEFVSIMPWSWIWTIDDSPLPWQTLSSTSNFSKRLNCQHFGLISNTSINHENVSETIESLDQMILYLWALLSTINLIPVEKKEVVPSKGFIAKGSYHKFLSHSTIHLNIPKKTNLIKLANKLVAVSRRRAHMVRGHYRHDWMHPGNKNCQHDWKAVTHETYKECKCGARLLSIHEHQRGDASLGFVTHDYSVEHGDNP